VRFFCRPVLPRLQVTAKVAIASNPGDRKSTKSTKST
jgi:hypothetical protein